MTIIMQNNSHLLFTMLCLQIPYIQETLIYLSGCYMKA